MHYVHLETEPSHDQSNTLHAIIVCSNPVRYQSRYRLFKDFVNRIIHGTHQAMLHPHTSLLPAPGLNLILVEMAFGDRPHEVTTAGNLNHVQLRSNTELWYKENLINLGVQRLTQTQPGWKHVAWIDADIAFQRPDWVAETIAQLQHYKVVQMWETAVDLGPNHEALQTHTSFMSQYHRGAPRPEYGQYGSGKLWHPGYAWAMRRDAWDALGGLIDFAVLGAGDNHMAYGLIGEVAKTFPKYKDSSITSEYAKDLLQWGALAERHIKRDVGYVPGTLWHEFHGKKKDRRYWDRWKILIDNQFTPGTDLKRDSQGLYQLEVSDTRQRTLRDQIRAYFRQRNEDSIDVI